VVVEEQRRLVLIQAEMGAVFNAVPVPSPQTILVRRQRSKIAIFCKHDVIAPKITDLERPVNRVFDYSWATEEFQSRHPRPCLLSIGALFTSTFFCFFTKRRP
jgi:hypothetical protein